jgi:hypothetical protein
MGFSFPRFQPILEVEDARHFTQHQKIRRHPLKINSAGDAGGSPFDGPPYFCYANKVF